MGKSEFEEVTAIIGGFFRCLGCWNDTENKEHKATKGLLLHVVFDDGKDWIYDVNDDINTIKGYEDLRNIHGLFEQVQLDESRTCVYWNDFIDLPSDAIYENASVPYESINLD